MTKAHSATKMVVRNLAPRTTAQHLSTAFAAHGHVRSVSLATDVMTGCCRGFGFVSLDEPQAGAALQALDGSKLGGRIISVSLDRKTIRVTRHDD